MATTDLLYNSLLSRLLRLIVAGRFFCRHLLGAQDGRACAFCRTLLLAGLTGVAALSAQETAPASGRDPIHIRLTNTASVQLEDGSHALLCPRGFYAWMQVSASGTHLELSAERAVVFYGPVDSSALMDPNALAGNQPTGLYLEGDVVLRADTYQGFQDNRFTADRIYYNLTNHTALLMDSTLRMVFEDQRVPLYIRAEQIRQLGLGQYQADRVQFSNSEFHTPHLGLQVDRIDIVNARAPLGTGAQAQGEPAAIHLKNIRVNLEETPIFWWPKTRGATASKPSPLLSANLGNDSEFGVSVMTEWDLPWLLGVQTPAGVDTRLRLDEYTKRGAGAGIDSEYTRDDYFGTFKGFLQQDEGEDRLGRYPSRRNIEPDTELRGRLSWQHRHYLAYDWQASLELNYFSDENYRESWYEREFDTEKTPETLLYFKQQRDNWAVDLLQSFQLNSYDYTMAQQPALGFHIAGQRLFDLLTWDHDGFISRVNEQAGNRRVSAFGSDQAPWTIPDLIEQNDYTYGVSRHELALPLQAGPVNISPTLIGTYLYDDSEAGYNSVLQGAAGVRGSMTFWRVDRTVQSRLWDIDQIRHIVTPEVSAFLVDSDHPDEPARDVLNLAVYQRWQTRRGPRDNQHTVDFFRLNTSVTLVDHDTADNPLPNRFWFTQPEQQYDLAPFVNGDLSNFGLARRRSSYLTQADFAQMDWLWQISDTTQLTGLVNTNLYDGDLSQLGHTLSVERSPRLRYYLGHYFLKNGDPFRQDDGQYVSGGFSYRLSEKYTSAFTQQYDLTQNGSNYTNATLIREFPHWFGAFSVGYDATRESTSFTISVWPEGFGSLALGKRKFSRMEP